MHSSNSGVSRKIWHLNFTFSITRLHYILATRLVNDAALTDLMEDNFRAGIGRFSNFLPLPPPSHLISNGGGETTIHFVNYKIALSYMPHLLARVVLLIKEY